MQTIKAKDIIAYSLFPQIVPRFKALFFSGFGYTALLIAHVFAMVRLLPKGHPYLNAKNMGRYGVRHVVKEAAANLRFTRNNIDQIVIFFALIAGIAILFIQFALAIYAIFGQYAHAQMFNSVNPTNDLSFLILNRVFGVPDVFCDFFTGCPASNPNIVGAATDSAFHNALHGLFRFYSTALLLIGTLIFLYFFVVVVLETAVSGTPFGKRFQNVWAPIRLVVAIALLLPLGFGLNSAQYITLYTAKYGSNLATNGWLAFNIGIATHPLFGANPLNSEESRAIGERYTFLAIPQQIEIASLVASMSLVHACAYSYLHEYLGVRNPADQGAAGAPPHYVYGDYTDSTRNYQVAPYFVKAKSAWMDNPGLEFVVPIDANHRLTRLKIPDATTFTDEDALAFYFGGDVVVRFGEYTETSTGEPMFGEYEGGVKPLCGDIRIPVTSLKGANANADGSPGNYDAEVYGGAAYMFKAYYEMVLNMWFNDDKLKQFARSYVTFFSGVGNEYQEEMCGAGAAAVSGCGQPDGFPACEPEEDCAKTTIDVAFKADRINEYQGITTTAIRRAWALYITASDEMNIGQNILDCGWACSGAWYNKIAEVNGMFIDGVRNIPAMSTYPLVMEQVRAEKKKVDMNITPETQFVPDIRTTAETSGTVFISEGEFGLEIARSLNRVYTFWGGDTLNQARDDLRSTGNPFLDVMSFFFGAGGVIDMRGANRHMHPLAQLVAVGKGLVDKAVASIAASSGMALTAGVMGSINDPKIRSIGGAFEALSKMVLSMAFIGLMAGFVLFYVLPFLPFVYVFFAVGTWVKTIFEAMVGTPLWALAHLRIDGEGLPGDAASNGYFLLLEILIRPILTVFGLVAAILILGAQVRVLDLIWDAVVTNAGGGNSTNESILPPVGALPSIHNRNVIDQFFFMIIYTIICYMLAVASFKLIDQIPNGILRWAGAGVAAFGDMNGENASELSGKVSSGGMTYGQEAADTIRSGAKGLGGGLGSMIGNMGKAGNKS